MGLTLILATLIGFGALTTLLGISDAKGTTNSQGIASIITIYVATNGSDSWSGKLAAPNAQGTDGPFATLSRARDQVRAIKQEKGLIKPIKVVIRAGKYFLNETLDLDGRDSGTKQFPIEWSAYRGEKVTISGGRRITGWRPYRGGILQADFPGTKTRQLFFNGERQILARTPNCDPMDPLYSGWSFFVDYVEPDGFKYADGLLPQPLAKPTQAEVCFFFRVSSSSVSLKSIDYDNRIIHTAYRGAVGPFSGFNAGARFRLENALEMLDQPGEWCVDTEVGKLYFWPPSGLNDKSEVVVPQVDTLLAISRAGWITISGLTFSEGAGEGIRLQDAQNIRIEDNRLYGLGSRALVMRGRDRPCANNIIQYNEISYADGSGIYAGGSACGNQILDNDIHHCALFNMYNAGIEFPFYGGTYEDISKTAYSDGNLIAHNYVHDLPRDGIMLGANPYGRNIVEYNRVERVCMETIDAGGVRCHKYISHIQKPEDIQEMKGHIFRYNLIVDAAGCDSGGGQVLTPWAWPVFGIYLDEMSENCTVYGNIVVRAGVGVGINPGRKHTIENNIFIDCPYNIFFQDAMPPNYRHLTESMVGNCYLRNIFYSTNAERLTTPRGWDKYPFLFGFTSWTDEVLGQSDYNLFFRSPGWDYVIETQTVSEKTPQKLSLTDWQAKGYDVHSVIADPLIVNAGRGDYRLRPESPALKLGFLPIDVAKIGIRSRAAEAPSNQSAESKDPVKLYGRWAHDVALGKIPGLQREIDPKHSALVIIDVERITTERSGFKGAVDEFNPKLWPIWEKRRDEVFWPSLEKLLDFFRSKQLPIIFCYAGNEGPHPRLKPRKNEWLVHKPHPGGFLEPEFVKILQDNKIDTLFMAGLDASHCVSFTSHGALDWGYQVIMVGDACGDPRPDHLDAILKVMSLQGYVTTADKVISDYPWKKWVDTTPLPNPGAGGSSD
ncbi:MAG: isochorismatase family protein [Armatimonadetes bacterium]|nr:isochorismatase family protein [Armatimonadota bacterium]